MGLKRIGSPVMWSDDGPGVCIQKIGDQEINVNHEAPEDLEVVPDPSKFEILETHEIGGGTLQFLVAIVRYPQLKEYEGRKILVYKNVKPDWFKRWQKIDPHFSELDHRKTPVARFKPTVDGMGMALSFCHWMVSMNMARNLDYVRLSSDLEEEHVKLVIKVGSKKDD